MDQAEAVLSYGRSRWPVWVRHAHREQHWRVLEIIEPDTTAARPAGTNRYILLVDGPFTYLKGSDGEQYITATRRDGRWWITPNTSVYPRREPRPATDAKPGCHSGPRASQLRQV